jgi:hypothetical protein
MLVEMKIINNYFFQNDNDIFNLDKIRNIYITEKEILKITDSFEEIISEDEILEIYKSLNDKLKKDRINLPNIISNKILNLTLNKFLIKKNNLPEEEVKSFFSIDNEDSSFFKRFRKRYYDENDNIIDQNNEEINEWDAFEEEVSLNEFKKFNWDEIISPYVELDNQKNDNLFKQTFNFFSDYYNYFKNNYNNPLKAINKIAVNLENEKLINFKEMFWDNDDEIWQHQLKKYRNIDFQYYSPKSKKFIDFQSEKMIQDPILNKRKLDNLKPDDIIKMSDIDWNELEGKHLLEVLNYIEEGKINVPDLNKSYYLFKVKERFININKGLKNWEKNNNFTLKDKIINFSMDKSIKLGTAFLCKKGLSSLKNSNTFTSYIPDWLIESPIDYISKNFIAENIKNKIDFNQQKINEKKLTFKEKVKKNDSLKKKTIISNVRENL